MTSLAAEGKQASPGLNENWWSEIQEKAKENYQKNGFPSKAHEEWKYTNLAKVEESSLQTIANPSTTANLRSPLESSFRIVMIDGAYAPDSSILPNYVQIVSVNALSQEDAASKIINKLYAPQERQENKTHIDLNTSDSSQAIIIHISAGKVVEQPIEIHHVISKQSEGSAQTQLWLQLEQDSSLTIFERFYGEKEGNQNSGEVFQNHVSRIRLEKNAQLTHYKIQDLPSNTTHLYNGELSLFSHSSYNAFSYSSGAKLSRHELSANVLGEGVRCEQQGITLGKDNQHHDAFLPVYHNHVGSFSSQNFRQLLDGASKGIFYGKIVVPEGSDKTEAHQSNHNILLSDKAQAFSRPELDIQTDDVICSHGTTVGNLDEEAMYYLLSRGLDKDQAKHLLLHAFVFELIETIRDEQVKKLMKAHLDIWAETLG